MSKGSDYVEYVYLANGEKLAKKKNGVFVNFYCGSFVYKGDKSLEYIAHSEGLAQKNGSLFDYQYNLTDHLGNVRNVLNASGTSIQSNNYYPFGLTHNAPANFAKNKYLYNGKEAQDETIGGTIYNVLDYHARSYDPVIGKMLEPDPMQEKYFDFSSYAYCINNPMKYIDFDGKDILIAFTGGPSGGGKSVNPNSSAAASTGKLFNTISNYAQENGINLKGTVITPGLTARNSINNAMNFIQENYMEGEKIIIYGYSYGGDFAVELSESLGKNGLNVDLLVTVDASDGPAQNSTVNTTIPDNVIENQNYYQTNSSGLSSGSQNVGSGKDSGSSNSPGSRGGANKAKDPQKTTVMNINMTGKGVTHGNIPLKAMPLIEDDIKRVLKGE